LFLISTTHRSPEPPPSGGSSQIDDARLWPGGNAVLETRDLTIRFGGHVAVDHVSCRFEPGTLTAIVGPNGAGKTTYFNLISGQLPASEGRVLLNGDDLTKLPAPLRTRRGLGRAFQLTQLFPNLTVLENVRLAVQARWGGGLELLRVWLDRKAWLDEARQLLQQVQLGDKLDQHAAALPHGDQRKLEVALLMALDPKVYMFDEPTAGMSVDDVPVILDLIRALKAKRNSTILLVEHKMDVVRELSDRIVVLHNGQLVADGEPAAVIASPVVQQAYLGVVPEEVQ
jgi:branched-chain amino acid transport system ATP-binding protein